MGIWVEFCVEKIFWMNVNELMGLFCHDWIVFKLQNFQSWKIKNFFSKNFSIMFDITRKQTPFILFTFDTNWKSHRFVKIQKAKWNVPVNFSTFFFAKRQLIKIEKSREKRKFIEICMTIIYNTIEFVTQHVSIRCWSICILCFCIILWETKIEKSFTAESKSCEWNIDGKILANLIFQLHCKQENCCNIKVSFSVQ